MHGWTNGFFLGNNILRIFSYLGCRQARAKVWLGWAGWSFLLGIRNEKCLFFFFRSCNGELCIFVVGG